MPVSERLALLVATGLGLGFSPVAPGTVGSLATLPLAWALWHAGGTGAILGGALVATVVGVWAAGVTARGLGASDPGPVVIDEVAGQLVSLAFIAPSPQALAIAFVLFRVFDVWKPVPIRRLEKLPGGSGIMADDLLAGVYANLVHQALRHLLSGGWGGG